MPLKLFTKKSKGSITVFVTLIMVPTIFFTSFLGDLARIKLYGNIALMTADNYSESILTEYNDLLRELYGFMAVTDPEQSATVKSALDTLNDYSKSSFNPNDSTISYEYLQSVLGTTSFDGFAPYSSAEVDLSYEFVEGANLSSKEEFATQLGDFMKFRIAQQLLMSGDVSPDGELGDGFINMSDIVSENKDDAQVFDKQEDLADELEDYLEAVGMYYFALKLIDVKYYEYLQHYLAYEDVAVWPSYKSFASSKEYKEYFDYKEADSKNPNPITQAQEKKDKGEELSDEEQNLLTLKDNYSTNSNTVTLASTSYKNMFSSGLNDLFLSEDNKIDDDLWKNSGKSKNAPHYVNAGNFNELVLSLDSMANDLSSKALDVKSAIEALRTAANKDGVSSDVKNSALENITLAEKFSNDQKLELFKNIAAYEYDNIAVNADFVIYSNNSSQFINDLKTEFNDAKVEKDYDFTDPNKLKTKRGLTELFTEDKLIRLSANTEYYDFYKELDNAFGTLDNEKKKEAEDKKDDAKKKAEEASEEAKKAEEDSKQDVRSIPDSYSFGSSEADNSSSSLKDSMKKVGSLFSEGDWGNAGNDLLLKVYSTEYDFGMFSSRVTEVNKKKQNSENYGEQVLDNATSTSSVSLTGYEKCKSINYLYGAELEYILHGSNDSEKNLNYTRNMILGFRMIMNFASTYKIEPVDTAIKSLSTAVEAVPYVGPALKIILDIALRAGFAAMETAQEWKKLLEGESILVFKSKFEDLEIADTVLSWLPIELSDDDMGKSEGGVYFNYEQYVMIMMMFLTSSDKIYYRTQNLVELNVNAVSQKVGESGSLPEDYGSLSFKMANAHTAVKSTCKVHMDFALIPDNFAALMFENNDQGTLEELEEFEKSSYQFSVIRGY